MKANDIKTTVTAKIVDALKSGVAPWIRPWKTVDALPYNGKTKRQYNGINVLLLWWAANANGYSSGEWYTFKQAQEKGGQVRKGEKATLVIFWKMLRKDEKDAGGNTVTTTVPLLRYYNVFNRAQIDGLPELPSVEVAPFEADMKSEAVIASTGANITHGGNDASYAPKSDSIRLPNKEQFETSDAYYATAFHELGHWTGHESRLNREGVTNMDGFGTPRYAHEELVAELTSAFCCAQVGLTGKLQHPNYIAHWIKMLEDDHNIIFQANSKAMKAMNFIFKNVEEEDEEEGE